MLFATVPLALLATEPRLETDAPVTLVGSALAISTLQTIRGIVGLQHDAFSALLMGVLALLLTPAVAVALVLFGAPVAYSQVETMACAMVISTLALQPLLMDHGLNATMWRRIVSLQLPASGIYYGSLGTLIGAWFGAVPIALDWDRPWQTYPITIVLGAYAGTALGTFIGSVLQLTRKSTTATNRRRVVKRKVAGRR